MFFGYPSAANANNWLHDCLIEILKTIHVCHQDQLAVPEWPEIIPEVYRDKLSKRTGLQGRLVAYQETIAKLDQGELSA